MSSNDTRVFLWCVPRSVSTAVLKCMSNVPGVVAWNEPYTVAYLNSTLYNPMYMPDNPKMTKVRRIMTTPIPQLREIVQKSPRGKLQAQKLFTYCWVKDQLEAKIEKGKKFIFVKDMALSVSGRHGDLPVSYRHTFLIRDPVQVQMSWKRLVAADFLRTSDEESVDITEDAPFCIPETFFKSSYELWKYAMETAGGDAKPLVIDAHDLLNHPDIILRKYFKEIGLEFDEKYLDWDASQNVVQKWRGCFELTTGGGLITAYGAAVRSSCFKPIDKPNIEVSSLPSDVQKCIAESMPFYEAMYEKRITAD